MSRTVLVADDNLTMQRVASEILSQAGLDVVTVANGVAAIKKLPALKPLVVLADADMPGKDGYEVCDFVKNQPELSYVRVLLAVSDMDPYDQERGVRAQVDGIIKKPFDREQLVSTVARWLAQAETLSPQLVTEPANETTKLPEPPAGEQLQGLESLEVPRHENAWEGASGLEIIGTPESFPSPLVEAANPSPSAGEAAVAEFRGEAGPGNASLGAEQSENPEPIPAAVFFEATDHIPWVEFEEETKPQQSSSLESSLAAVPEASPPVRLSPPTQEVVFVENDATIEPPKEPWTSNLPSEATQATPPNDSSQPAQSAETHGASLASHQETNGWEVDVLPCGVAATGPDPLAEAAIVHLKILEEPNASVEISGDGQVPVIATLSALPQASVPKAEFDGAEQTAETVFPISPLDVEPQYPLSQNSAEPIDSSAQTADQPVPIDMEIIELVVHKVISRMSPPALAPEAVRDLETKLINEIVTEIATGSF